MLQRYRVLVLCVLVSPAWAIGAEGTHPCAVVVDPAARLGCYDKAFPPPPEVHEAAARKVVDEFGLDQGDARPLASSQAPAVPDPDRIGGRVVEVDHGNGRRRVVLDNGQAWTLTESNSAGPLRPGDEVQVRKGLMGSYLLRTPSGVTLRVRRTR